MLVISKCSNDLDFFIRIPESFFINYCTGNMLKQQQQHMANNITKKTNEEKDFVSKICLRHTNNKNKN